MNLMALVGTQRATASDAVKPLKAESIGFCILKAVRSMSPDSEPWRVRLAAEQYRDKVITDGAFFGTVNRLKGSEYLEMVRYRREIRVGDSARHESIGVYRLTDHGGRCLDASEQKLNDAQRRELERKLNGAFATSQFSHQP